MTIVTIARSHIRNACIAALSAAALLASPVAAQPIETFDPSDVSEQPGDGPIYADERVEGDFDTSFDNGVPADAAAPSFGDQMAVDGADVSGADVAPSWSDPDVAADGVSVAGADPVGGSANAGTYGEDDLIGAAEGVFGKGAEGVAKLIRDLLKDQGEPNAYIVGREAGGAFVVGARYGSGTLFHKVEGERKVYWTGPSVGLDAGANAGNTFVLVYNLYDSEDLFKRFPAGEGQAYLVGGLHASYLRRGDIVMIPIRVGAGLRLGVNAGYLRFSKKHRWLPF